VNDNSAHKSVDVAYLFAELELATTALQSARLSGDPENMRRCHQLAKIKEATISYYLSVVRIPEADREQIVKRLDSLRDQLFEIAEFLGAGR
jgi:hypothetical protein